MLTSRLLLALAFVAPGCSGSDPEDRPAPVEAKPALAPVPAATPAARPPATTPEPKPTPPPPPPSPMKVYKKIVKETVQPVKVEREWEEPVEDLGEEGGVEGGVADGVMGGVASDGVAVDMPPPPPPPPPPPSPQIVPQVAMEAQRISGEKMILPDASTKAKIAAEGKERVLSVFKLCVDTGGRVESVRKLKSSGYADYDARIESAMRDWKYRPFKVRGVAASVCSSVTLVYVQKP